MEIILQKLSGLYGSFSYPHPSNCGWQVTRILRKLRLKNIVRYGARGGGTGTTQKMQTNRLNFPLSHLRKPTKKLYSHCEKCNKIYVQNICLPYLYSIIVMVHGIGEKIASCGSALTQDTHVNYHQRVF